MYSILGLVFSEVILVPPGAFVVSSVAIRQPPIGVNLRRAIGETQRVQSPIGAVVLHQILPFSRAPRNACAFLWNRGYSLVFGPLWLFDLKITKRRLTG
jgi:hypothetical protein